MLSFCSVNYPIYVFCQSEKMMSFDDDEKQNENKLDLKYDDEIWRETCPFFVDSNFSFFSFESALSDVSNWRFHFNTKKKYH